MSAFKNLLTSDVVVSPFEVNKSFTFIGSASLYDNGIDRYKGYNQSDPTTLITGSGFPESGYIISQSSYLVYKSIEQLYYSNFYDEQTSGSIANRPTYNPDGTIIGEQKTTNNYNYPQTTLFQDRFFPSNINSHIDVISIPSSLFGEKIQPRSISIYDGYGPLEFTDDGNGILYRGTTTIGNVIYEHGIIIISKPYKTTYSSASLYDTSNITCSFSSSIILHETQYKCIIRENEFNFSQNPTTISGSKTDGILQDYITGSYFSPYITSIGLYDNEYNLLAVAKLSQPLPTSQTTDTTILINLDI